MPSFPLFSSQGKGAFDLTQEEKENLTAFLKRLIDTPSYPTQEGAVAELIIRELTNLGITNTRVDRVGNVIVDIGTGDGPVLLFDAHMDTVLATDVNWKQNPHDAVTKDGIMYGLGASDMKGAIAAMVYAAKKLQESGANLYGRLILAFVVQEEPCEGCALKALINLENIKPDWVVLGEPSNLELMRGQRGRVLFKITVRGRSSHASSPELGDNAIVAASRLIFGVDLLAAALTTRDPFLGEGSIAVTHIESQAPSLNAIPDTCTFYIDRRLTLGETHTRAQAQIEGVIEREGIDADISVVEYAENSYAGFELNTREAFNAWLLDENHELLQAVSKVIKKTTGTTPAISHWPFSTDGVYSMAEAGIPTIGVGPGNPKHAHTVDDQVILNEVFTAVEIYAQIAVKMLKQP